MEMTKKTKNPRLLFTAPIATLVFVNLGQVELCSKHFCVNGSVDNRAMLCNKQDGINPDWLDEHQIGQWSVQ
jgi:hypothetical protein